MKVENFLSDNNTRVRNQFIYTADNGEDKMFVSYSSKIAMWKGGRMFISQYWNYSVTTRKYLYQFLRRFGYFVHGHKDVEVLLLNRDIELMGEYDMAV